MFHEMSLCTLRCPYVLLATHRDPHAPLYATVQLCVYLAVAYDDYDDYDDDDDDGVH